MSVSQNLTANSSSYHFLYRGLCDYFLIWYLPIVVAVGTIGGLFCLIFLFLSRLFPKNILIWMVSICVGDLMILLCDALRMLIKLWFAYDIRDAGTMVCKLHNYFSNYFLYWSAYMQACMSLQRLYFVRQPLKARMILPFKRVCLLWAVVTTLCILPHLPYLLYWQVQDNTDCEPNDTWYYYITSVNDLVIWGIIPLVSMTISTLLISIRIFNFRTTTFRNNNNTSTAVASPVATTQQRLLQAPSSSAVQRTENGIAASGETVERLHPPVASTSTPSRSDMGQRHGGVDNARNVTRLLVSMNLFYMVTTYPLLIYEMYLNFGLQNQVGTTIPQPLHKFFYYLLRSLCYMNSSLNWLFYCAAGRVFRRRASRILFQTCCFWSRWLCPQRWSAMMDGSGAGQSAAAGGPHHAAGPTARNFNRGSTVVTVESNRFRGGSAVARGPGTPRSTEMRTMRHL